jgi:ribosome-associated protein
MSTKIEQIKFKLNSEYIELVKLLKILKIAGSGGQIKQIIEQEEVIRNGCPETRKRAKIRINDVIQVFSVQIKII